MTPQRHQQIKNVFLAVVERPRSTWDKELSARCAGDEDLRKEVRLLLDCHVDVREMLPGAEVPPPAFSERPTEDPSTLQRGRQESAPAIPLRNPLTSRRPGSMRGGSAGGERPHSSIASDQGRFLPGMLIADRYRIVALVGRGGMGEVYRADDLKLGQAVALKFLPAEIAEKPGRMQSLLDEVRVARVVSHPNVCRVYDIGEHQPDKNHREMFISMEFVDGETLDSLISRIGRLPEKKAEQIAQQLCAGLAAIHDEGVLHRDLKPANVMIDGRGHVRVNDFGLASARDIYGLEAIAGTPGFVPPESLMGKQASQRSDIYALGLVLYELFTGVPAYRGRTREQLIREQESQDPDSPAVHAQDLPNEVVQTIVRCLQRDPAERPRSAREVAGMLPGGDALAAALAAGDTPSPSAVAASGGRGVLTSWQAIAGVMAFAGLLVVALVLGQRASLIRRVPLPKSPEVLTERARQMLGDLGYSVMLPYEFSTLDLYEEWLDELVRKDQSSTRSGRLERTRPAPIDFWYRSAKGPLLPRNPRGAITYYDPTVIEQGMITLRMSCAGHLRELAINSDDLFWPKGGLVRAERAPPGTSDEPAPVKEPNYAAAFRAAGLDMSKFVPVEPKRVPPVYADTRAAWVGEYPDNPSEPVQVEIASHDGRIVAFRTVELNWQGSQTAIPRRSLFSRAQEVGLVILALVQLVSLAGALVLARRNLRDRRGDRLGAARLAVFVSASTALYGVLAADTLSNQNVWFGITGWIIAQSVSMGAAAWLLYMGFEPYVRRIWPEMLVSWSRLIDGRWRDPLVGQSVLIGGIGGCAAAAMVYLNRSIPDWVGGVPAVPFYLSEFELESLGALPVTAGVFVHIAVKAVQVSMGFVALLALARLVVKRPWLALLIWGAVQTATLTLGQHSYTGWWSPLIVGAMIAVAAGVLLHNGLLGLIALIGTMLVILVGPITLDDKSWFYDRSIATLCVLGAVMVGAAVIALLAPPQKRLLSGSGTGR